jgi:signal transduction histidine kinase
VIAMLASRYGGAMLVAITLFAAPAIDVAVLGAGHLIASLYGVPILLAAPLWRPSAVAVLAVLVVTLYAVAGAVQGDDLELWLLYALSLVMIAALGILLSAQRRQTERRAHEAELARRQLQTFMSMVAHELSTPTTGILGRAQLALRSARQSRERRALVAIEAEARGLARLVNDLRDAGRAGAGAFEIHPAPTDLAALVAEVIEQRRRSARDREIALEIDLEPRVECDAGRIGQVVDNLISNAIKYSAPDEPIAVRVWQDGADALVSVTDRGVGIDETERARLFLPFSRLERTRRTPGTGLGLYVSRAIVEAHGGAIDVISAIGVGSVFVVRLPGAAVTGTDGLIGEASPA